MTSSASVTTLPLLSADERAHSDRVVEHIRAFMRERGVVSSSTFARSCASAAA
jgi:hypothetical protein